jgi:hypothetical protein
MAQQSENARTASQDVPKAEPNPIRYTVQVHVTIMDHRVGCQSTLVAHADGRLLREAIEGVQAKVKHAAGEALAGIREAEGK